MVDRFNNEDWVYPVIQERFIRELLAAMKHSQYASTIEGSLIDIFLNLLVDADQGMKRKLASASNIYYDSKLIKKDISLKPSGVDHIVNYLKIIMESTKVTMSSFFSIEVAAPDSENRLFADQESHGQQAEDQRPGRAGFEHPRHHPRAAHPELAAAHHLLLGKLPPRVQPQTRGARLAQRPRGPQPQVHQVSLQRQQLRRYAHLTRPLADAEPDPPRAQLEQELEEQRPGSLVQLAQPYQHHPRPQERAGQHQSAPPARAEPHPRDPALLQEAAALCHPRLRRPPSARCRAASCRAT